MHESFVMTKEEQFRIEEISLPEGSGEGGLDTDATLTSIIDDMQRRSFVRQLARRSLQTHDSSVAQTRD